MDIGTLLSQRISVADMPQIGWLIQKDRNAILTMYCLLLGQDEGIGFRAAWAFTHLPIVEREWLWSKQNELIDNLLICKHGGKQRVLLNLLLEQPFPDPPRVDFLDYILERIVTNSELPGVRSLAIKIAYELCSPIPELLQELKTILTMMDENLSPAIRSVRKKILKQIETRGNNPRNKKKK